MRGVLWVPWKFRLPAFSLLSSRRVLSDEPLMVVIQRGLVRFVSKPPFVKLATVEQATVF